MKDLFQEMYASLELKWHTQDTASGSSIDMGWGRLFGGQLLAQALRAGQEHQLSRGRVHSLHAHFLSTGSVSDAVEYRVFPIRQGRTYSAMRVEGWQNGSILFHALLSFQIPEVGPSRCLPPPDVPQPESLERYQTTLRQMVSDMPDERRRVINPTWKKRLELDSPIDVRPVRPSNYLIPDSNEPERVLWFKAAKNLSDDPSLHQQTLIWTSDFPMLGTALQPLNVPPVSPKIKMTSLDHTIWFYAPFRADEWMLCRFSSPVTGAGRGLVFAEIWQNDIMVACCSQEGMLRMRTAI